MSKNLQALLKESLLNNSYDYDSMHRSLAKTWTSSYSYLYARQHAFIEYEELFYFSGDDKSHNSKEIGHLYLDDMIRANFDVDYDLIHVMDREEFRTSKYYLHRFTLEDIADRPDIFNKMPIVLIDDKAIWDYDIFVTKDCTSFRLPYRRNFVLKNERNANTDEYIYIDHKIQVLVVDNVFYNRVALNKNTLNFSAGNKTIRVSKDVINKNLETYIKNRVDKALVEKYKVSSVSMLPDTSAHDRLVMTRGMKKVYEIPDKNQTGIMFGSLHFTLPEEKRLPGHLYPTSRVRELGSQLIEFKVDPRDDNWYEAKVTDDIAREIDKCNYTIYLSLCFMNRLIHHKLYNGDLSNVADSQGTQLMVLQQDEYLPYEQPVPIENFMVFKRDADKEGRILQRNTDMIELHYPNIYRIKDSTMKSGDSYDVYYFYHKDDSMKYTCLFDFYYYFLRDVFPSFKLEKLLNDIYFNRLNLSMYDTDRQAKFKEIFKKLCMDYKYYNHQYAEIDFLHRYLPLPENYDKIPTEYKDETLKKWIRVQPWVLRDYVLDQKKLGTSFHLFTNTIDLKSRVRTSTLMEFEQPGFEQKFESPRYVFAIANERDYPLLLDCRVFVDGILVGDLYEDRRNFMEYLYIPVEMVTADSYIEVEIFPSYQFKKAVTFTSMNQKEEITIAEPRMDIWPTQADIYFQDNNENEIHKIRYNRKLFDYTMHYADKGSFDFNSNDPKKPVKFTRLSKFSCKPNDEVVLNKPLWLTISKKNQIVRFKMCRNGYPYIEIFDHDFQFKTDYIRVFRNGRLIPRSHYRLLTTYAKPRLIFMEWMDKGDIIYIDITPYRYTEIYYQEELHAKELTIDLRKIVDKPFDIRYYDVYMNGRKLSVNNVFSITPWEMTLVNLKSNYNLVIYERERDWEYFGLDYNENIYYFTLDDLFNSGVVNEDEKHKILKDIIDAEKDPRLNIYPNTNDEEKMRWDNDELIYAIFHIFYFDELIPKTYVNPDRLQFSDEVMQDNYMEIYQRYKHTSEQDAIYDFEKTRRKNYPGVIELDPDIYVKSTRKDDDPALFLFTDSNLNKNTGEMSVDVDDIRNLSPYLEGMKLDPNLTYYLVPIYDRYIVVYCVGHIGDVDQELLDQSIKINIPSDGNI